MSDVLSGLESMGLGNLSNIELFNDKKQKADEEKKKAEKAKEVKELEEKDLIYLKNVECPCCGKEFKERAIRPGKARMISQDTDLRPRYKELDTMKYVPYADMRLSQGISHIFHPVRPGLSKKRSA